MGATTQNYPPLHPPACQLLLYLDRLQRRCASTDQGIVLPPAADCCRDARRGVSDGPEEEEVEEAAAAELGKAEIDLFRPIGAFVSAVSCSVLGLHSLEFEQEPITVNMLHFMLLTTLSHRLGVPENIMRWLGMLVARRSAHDIQLRAAVARAVKLSNTAEGAGASPSFLKTLVDE